MTHFIKYILLLSFFALTSLVVQGQITAATRDGTPKEEEVPQNIKENLAKLRISQDKKDHDELIERGEQALKISEQLEFSFKNNNKFTNTDYQNLKELEKLLKKIRKELGGSDDDSMDEEDTKPTDLGEAVKNLRENTINLLEFLQKTTRHSISATAIKTSNTVLDVIKFMRFWKN